MQQSDALAFLQRIAAAARELNYAGTFVYQHGDQVETYKITHFVENGIEHEKRETLDGPRRETVRDNDEVTYFYPDMKLVRSDKNAVRRTFPSLLPEQLSSLTEYYEIRKGESVRIGGMNSQSLVLEPRDGMRYGHKFWADSATGLLLRARMVSEKQNVVEQFSFTQLTIGAGITREMTQPTFNARPPEWHVDRSGANTIADADSNWVVKNFPAGFRKILEMRRSKGSNAIVTHMVYSDGLAAVSVFIEPAASRNQVNEGPSQQGAINIYIRAMDDQIVTVLGEAPASTVMQIANSISPRVR